MIKFQRSSFYVLISAISIQSVSWAAGPLVVDDAYVQAHGNVISGIYQGTETQPAISVQTTKPVFIKNAFVTGPGDLISGNTVDLNVLNTRGYGMIPDTAGVTRGAFVSAENVKHLTVKNCYIEKVKLGVYVARFIGDRTGHSATVNVVNNSFRNIDGRASDGAGGQSITGSARAHAIQLNGVQGVPNIEIAWNQIIDEPYLSEVVDTINLYDSSGITTNHIKIHDNYLQGAWPGLPAGESYAGGGIITDGAAAVTDPTLKTAWVDVYNNQVVASSNYGLRIAAGHDNAMYNNRVISSGYLSSGLLAGSAGKGEGLQNYNAYAHPVTTFFNNHLYSNNPVGFVRADSVGQPYRSDFYLPGQNFNNENNVSFTPVDKLHPTRQDELNEYLLWKSKVATADQLIGPQG